MIRTTGLILGFLTYVPVAVALQAGALFLAEPPDWTCSEIRNGWRCEPIGVEQGDALLLVVSGMENGSDAFQRYDRDLSRPKTQRLPDGTQMTAEILSHRVRRWNDRTWIDSFQLNAQLKDYYSRRLVTVDPLKDHDAVVMVSYILSKKGYTKWQSALGKTIASLRVRGPLVEPVSPVRSLSSLPRP